MEHNLEQTLSLLASTPPALSALLRDLPPAWTMQPEGDGTWSVFDVVGHLIHAERTNWMPRVKMMLQSGEHHVFESFDRSGHVRESRAKSLADLLDEFADARLTSLGELRALKLAQEDFDRRGRHPALGPVSMSELLAAWAVHDLTHVHQISRVMARQYRDAVGPWRAYLGVLQCAGHSSD